jgi:hypothetical protein
MSGTILAATILVVGISTGWKPLPEGGYEYIIQIEPQTLQTLSSGQNVYSDILPALRGIRSYRITVGTGPVPREGTPPAAEPTAAVSPRSPPKPLTPDPSSRPVAAQNASYLENGPPQTTSPQSPQADKNEPQKQWPLLMAVLAGLLGSVSGNLYLGWITWETRSRYRRLLRHSDTGPRPDSPAATTVDDPLHDVEP